MRPIFNSCSVNDDDSWPKVAQQQEKVRPRQSLLPKKLPNERPSIANPTNFFNRPSVSANFGRPTVVPGGVKQRQQPSVVVKGPFKPNIVAKAIKKEPEARPFAHQNGGGGGTMTKTPTTTRQRPPLANMVNFENDFSLDEQLSNLRIHGNQQNAQQYNKRGGGFAQFASDIAYDELKLVTQMADIANAERQLTTHAETIHALKQRLAQLPKGGNCSESDFDVLLALTAEFAERESRLKSERTVVAKQREQFLRLLSSHSELLTAELNDMGTLSRRFEEFVAKLEQSNAAGGGRPTKPVMVDKEVQAIPERPKSPGAERVSVEVDFLAVASHVAQMPASPVLRTVPSTKSKQKNNPPSALGNKQLTPLPKPEF